MHNGPSTIPRRHPRSAWSFDHSSASSILAHALSIVELSRPLVEAIQRKDRDLANQLRRAISSIALNLSEGFGCAGGNARLRFESARGSLNEAQAGIYVAVAWRYVSLAAANAALESMHALGGRVYGLPLIDSPGLCPPQNSPWRSVAVHHPCDHQIWRYSGRCPPGTPFAMPAGALSHPPPGTSDSTPAPHAAVILRASDGARRAYQRHEPEKTVLYKIVSEHLETFLGEVHDHHDKPLPKYVEKELRDYLECGLLQHGFAKAVCKNCGRTILVAFSCKRRGTCPSCNARRMCNGAAHLADHVIPDVPVRQWVLSVPFELRLLLACRADAFSTVTRLFVTEVFRWQRERAREAGLTKVRYGALVMQHRFGSSLNLNTHLHAVFPDGVFSRLPSGEVEFHELRQPPAFDLEEIAFNVHQRFMRWLRRHGLLKNEADDDFSNESPELSALEACAQGSLGLGNLVKKRTKPRTSNQGTDEGGFEQRAVNGTVGASHGYSLYAGNSIDAADKDARERLLRYCLRAPLSLERLSIAPDGNVIYQVKATRHGNETQRVMTPMQFMSRLVALIPPPFHPLLRYFGVFGPHAAWRKAVVPEVGPAAELPHDHAKSAAGSTLKPNPSDSASGTSPKTPTAPTVASAILTAPAKSLKQETRKDDVGPRHAAPWRIDWATLLRRVHSVDALACPCGGRLKFVELITEPTTAREVLATLGLPTDLPPIARARSPDFYQESFPADWD